MTSYAHIGLGKCATTMLQKHVFPQLAADMRLAYMDLRDPRVRILRATVNTGLQRVEAGAGPAEFESAFLSCEGLLGWDPFEWPRRAAELAQLLPRDVKIILTLRRPRAYFYSAYVQRTLHSGDIIAPEQFFVSEQHYSPELAHPTFNVDRYNIAELIACLEQNFADVEILKFEDILVGRILGGNFVIPKVENRSLGAFSYKVMRGLQRGLSYVGLSFTSAEATRSQNDLADLAGRAPVRTRFPLRWVLNSLDRSGKIEAVNVVLDQYTAIFEREEATYARLVSGGRTNESISP